MREEFYASYDVMTGIRIAATLGGFFALMVFLIVYKSRSHSVRAMNVKFFFLFLKIKFLTLNLVFVGSKNYSSSRGSRTRRRRP